MKSKLAMAAPMTVDRGTALTRAIQELQTEVSQQLIEIDTKLDKNLREIIPLLHQLVQK